jgi:hypothetical protein
MVGFGAGSRGAGLTLTDYRGTQSTSTHLLETLAWLGITHRRETRHRALCAGVQTRPVASRTVGPHPSGGACQP